MSRPDGWAWTWESSIWRPTRMERSIPARRSIVSGHGMRAAGAHCNRSKPSPRNDTCGGCLGSSAGFRRTRITVSASGWLRLRNAPDAGLPLEDLRGIRARVRVRGAGQRARHSNWAFGQLRQFIAYKAQRAGVQVVAVDPRHTSQRCSACGHTSPADYNVAINIEWAAVNQPMVSNPAPRRLD
jgi:IS605 OrfB family transposase